MLSDSAGDLGVLIVIIGASMTIAAWLYGAKRKEENIIRASELVRMGWIVCKSGVGLLTCWFLFNRLI
jgi:hypothetical protein